MGWVRRLRGTVSRRDESFDEESRFHIDERTGDVDRFRWLDDFRRDVAYGLRMLRRSPGFSLLAILCLTLGIGANAAVFSWIEGILFRPYPAVTHQDRLVAVGGTARGEAGGNPLSWPDFL